MAEKTRSDGADEAGMARYLRARAAHVCMQLDVLSTTSEVFFFFFFFNGLSVLCAHVHICTYTPMQVKMAS